MGPTLSLYIYKKRGADFGGSGGAFYFFIFFSSLFDTWSFDRQNSSGQERKFIYSTRDTREYQKHGISPRIQVRSSKNSKLQYFLRSKAFWSELVGPRDKVDSRIASYTLDQNLGVSSKSTR